jgi:hypothetical protein
MSCGDYVSYLCCGYKDGPCCSGEIRSSFDLHLNDCLMAWLYHCCQSGQNYICLHHLHDGSRCCSSFHKLAESYQSLGCYGTFPKYADICHMDGVDKDHST